MIIYPDMVDEVASLIYDTSFGCAPGDLKRHIGRAARDQNTYSAQIVVKARARAILILAKVTEMTNQTYSFTTEKPANDADVQNPA